ncbi:MAG: hypothetical protein JJE55_08300 [Flavobacteriaceae bacterium]|nr:hypothetical protein [Flavobacteriaceae bacterium]
MRVIKVQQGQSLFDVAILTLGSALGAILIAGENNLSVTDTIMPGQTLNIPTQLLSKSTVNDFMANGINPATAVRINNETQYAVANYVVPNYWI